MKLLSKLALAVAAATAPATASQLSNSAPADQYFGPLKMSALGVRNRLNALGKRYHARTITNDDIIHDAKLIEASMAAWQQAYPHDPWVVSTYFHLEQIYQAVQSSNGRTHATIVLKFIAKEYPKTKEAHLSRLRLGQGFPPLHAMPAPHATPIHTRVPARHRARVRHRPARPPRSRATRPRRLRLVRPRRPRAACRARPPVRRSRRAPFRHSRGRHGGLPREADTARRWGVAKW